MYLLASGRWAQAISSKFNIVLGYDSILVQEGRNLHITRERKEERGKERGKETGKEREKERGKERGRREPRLLLLCLGCREIMPDDRACEEMAGSDLPKP